MNPATTDAKRGGAGKAPANRLGTALATLFLIGSAGASPARGPDARLAPPAAAECPRDRLTMYSGRVLSYRRAADRTVIRIRTEWQTTEEVTISHPGSSDPSRWFLLDRKRFDARDWPRIEQRPGRLRSGLRAAAWVGDDGRKPVVVWTAPPGR